MMVTRGTNENGSRGSRSVSSGQALPPARGEYIGAGTGSNRGMTVQIHGDLLIAFKPRQPRQRVNKESGVVRRHAQDRAFSGEHRDGAFDAREPSGVVSFEEKLPRPDAQADVLLVLAHGDRLPGQLAAAEDADRRNQHVILK